MRTPHLARLIAAIGIAFVIIVGVALTSGGRPMITANEPPAPPPLRRVTPPTTTTQTLAPRPGSLVLDGVNPCAILSSSQRADLSLDSKPTPYTDPEFDKAKACTMRGLESGTVARLALVVNMGVDVWLSDEAQVQTRAVTEDGFPALVVRTPGLTDACDVEVDTAQDQFLDVLFRDGGNTPPIPQDTLCQGAQRVAEAAVSSLKLRR
ncbi:MAG TPA: DUF3558 domain-containing protein [Pseudonocardiaceae bacterium]|jgi:hypothetical protein|nr:DUF3558 domain-containing protein [Pseudonocardiaceae bacterium]